MLCLCVRGVGSRVDGSGYDVLVDEVRKTCSSSCCSNQQNQLLPPAPFHVHFAGKKKRLRMARVAILGLGAVGRALMRQIAGMKGSGIGVIGVADSTGGLAMLRTPLSSDEV